jgi:peroxiredoxin
LWAGCAAPQRPVTTVAQVPEVELTTLDGKPMRVSQALGGKIGVVSLWATWCEACRDELEALSRLSQRAGTRGAVVLAVSVGEKRALVESFVRSHTLPYAQLVDEDYKLADALGARRVPATLVVDRDGRIVFSGGALDAEALAALRNALDHAVARR